MPEYTDTSITADGLALRQALAADSITVIHQNRRHVLYRVSRRHESLILKAAKEGTTEAGAIDSLRHEYTLLHGRDLPGVIKPLDLLKTDAGLGLILEDAGRHNLATHIGAGLATTEFLDIAVQLADAVAALHAAGILHRNINPCNIVWNADERKTTLIDFRLATSLSAPPAGSTGSARTDGALAYMSPEQTGRTGRDVDTRSDLYSLGATLYEMLTGAPPFTMQDPVELVHAHLARQPRPPHKMNAAIPPLLSDLVLKLLEKEPERRYLTAQALAADLQAARMQWSKTATLAMFRLGELDTRRRLLIPEKLYGRQNEIGLLHDAFDRARHGQRTLALVMGEPGIGKSVLVHALARQVAHHHGHFIEGKFDQLQRGLPYSGLVQAFRGLVRQLLTEPEDALARWKERINRAVAPNGQILVDVIPELERIIGKQAAVTELGPVESKNRFNQVFTSLLDIFARPGHPFVLFLDDLQWIDAASLQLLERWVGAADTGTLLIVGAYRENDVTAAHPLARFLADLRAAEVRIPRIRLGALDVADTAELLADTLGRTPEQCQALAQLVARKTAGNPFFIRRLLHALHHDGLIRFDAAVEAWQWDMTQLEHAAISDNVLDLMVLTIRRLPPATRDMLQAAACIGYRLDLGTLGEVMRLPRADTLEALAPAVQEGLLLPVDDAGALRFVHDRVQQAAYSLMTEDRRRAFHLAIGRQLRRQAAADLDARLFDIVDQLNPGAADIDDPSERIDLARLNFTAGCKAKTSAAYQAAFDYLSAALGQLPADAWDTHGELAFSIHRELAESAYLAGRHADAEPVFDTALAHAPSSIARADLYSLRVLAATVAGDWTGALHWGREGLAVFGHAWPLDGLAEANDAEARQVMDKVGDRPIATLVDAPEVMDKETCACMRLLSLLGPPAYFSGSEVLTFLVTRGTNLSLRQGPSTHSAYAYVFYGALHNARTGEYDVGHAFGQLALALAQRFGNRAEESRTLEVYGLVVHAWRAPLRDSLLLMKEGHRAGVESGELAYAAFNLCGILINGLPAGVPLGELLADAAVAIDFGTRQQNRTAVEISLPFRQLVRALTGETVAFGRFDGDGFDEKRFIDEAGGNQTALGQFWVARLQAAYLARNFAIASESAREASRYVASGILGMITSAEHVFYMALTAAAQHATALARDQAALVDEVRALHVQLATWAAHCPENFQHKRKLVEAELCRITGSPWKALELFTEAANDALQEGFIQDAALASELAARLFLSHGQVQLAEVHLRTAAAGYRRWGATAKAAAIETEHGGGNRRAARHAWIEDPGHASPLELDAIALIKASQAISAETVPERLFERIVRIVVEVAGAEAGILLLGAPGTLRVRAHIVMDDAAGFALQDTPLADYPALPAPIAHYVARMREPLVLDGAAARGPLAADPAVRAAGARSVLCVPLMKHERVVGLLYLENRMLTSAFTAERVAVVQALAAQAAISLENSTLLLERERAERAARFLASAGTTLAGSLDYAETLARVVDLAVPAFADWCFLDLVGADSGMRRAQVAFADPRHAGLAAQLKQFSATGTQPGHPPSRVLLEGQPVMLGTVAPNDMRALASGAEHLRLVEALGPRSIISAPLIARGRTFGILTCIVATSRPTYDEADLDTARKLADRCATAVDNALLYQEAQDAIRVREDFLAVASHELKTPLTPLQLQIHLIERRLPKLVENEQSAAWLAKSLATLQRQGKRLDRLVNELLDISRIAGGQLQLKRETVDLADVVNQVVERLEESGERAQSGSAMAVDTGVPAIGNWDRLRLDQVVTNLLSNALKYGEGKPVEVRVAAHGDHATVEVIDHGLGIEPEHLQRIFGRFERAVSARQYGGLGLGLYIASQIVTALDGTIHVASTLGHGATFTVRLPVAMGSRPA